MTDVDVVPVSWVGSPVVGPSVSVFHCADGDADSLLSGLHTYFTSLAPLFPEGLQWSFPGSGVVLDEPSGDVTGTWTASSIPAPVIASSGGTFVLGAGTRTVWSTDDFIGGRRVRGSTFLCPISAANFEGAGAIANSTISTLNAAAAALIAAAPTMCVYTRKNSSHTGSQHPVTSGQNPDKISWLRSRRT